MEVGERDCRREEEEWNDIFFQAEDGIRDYKVTGVQTCALPIYYPSFFLQDYSCLLQDYGAKTKD